MMLSENRRSQSNRMWLDFCMNPRGELWKKDKNNFGRKLMKKMGWKKGNGLGKEESGIKEPIRLVQTHDNEGLGYKQQMSDNSWNWLSHQDDFDCLLNELQQNHTDRNGFQDAQASGSQKTVDLEQKSKKSRKRVHYQRNIEGKDLSKRSQSDWKCILGTKRKRKSPMDSEPDPEIKPEKDGELLRTSSISVHDYFKFKRAKLEKRTEENGILEDPAQQMVTTEETSVCETSAEMEESITNCLKKRKSRKKRKKRKLERQRKRELEESETACSDSAIGSEVSGSCDGQQSTTTEPVSSVGSPYDSEELLSGCGTEIEKQDGVVSNEKGETETDEPLAWNWDFQRNWDFQVEKENHCQAEDSLIILKKFKRKKKRKRSKSEPILDMTHVKERVAASAEGESAGAANDSQCAGILKPRPNPDSGLGGGADRKKCVRFSSSTDVGYVPARDPVRGGAWVWKRKLLFSSL